jgi:hypothetical protein
LSPWRLAAGEAAQDQGSDKKGSARGHLSTI